VLKKILWAAELLFQRWQSILDMAGECKHSFAFPGAIFQAIRFRDYKVTTPHYPEVIVATL